VWYHFKGLQTDKQKFPYMAKSLSKKKNVQFDGIEDVYAELIALYDEAIEAQAPIGHSLYIQHFYFTSDTSQYHLRTQSTIKGMRFCDQTGTPPFPSLKDTPADYIYKHGWYTDELHHITEIERKKHGNR